MSGKLPVDTTASAEKMADAIFGNGITLVSANYTGATGASGIYSDGDQVAPDVTPSDTGVILSTGQASDITNGTANTNAIANTSTVNNTSGDADLDGISGQQTYDAAVLEAEFIPEGSTLTMQVIFSSDEYLEWVGSGFNDAVGIWVNGEPAKLTVGDGDITINNINDESNENLFVDNPASQDNFNTEMDGFTVTLTLKALVVPDEKNAIKIAIADGGDRAYDSNLLIAGASVQTALVAGDDTIEVGAETLGQVNLLANDSSSAGGTLTITHINGQPVELGDTVLLPTGEEITLTANGFVEVVSSSGPGVSTFSYTVEDSAGNTDVAFVELTTACFTPGILIDTEKGPVAIERLRVGDRVLTRDHGPQTLRWIGTSKRLAHGRDAPVALSKNALGDHDAMELSPNHRILVRSPKAALLFAEDDVLVRACDLVNGQNITRREDNMPVTYIHLLFDQHEIICGNGLESESYHPGSLTYDSFDASVVEELFRLFPELAETGQLDYGCCARRALRSFEARALLN